MSQQPKSNWSFLAKIQRLFAEGEFTATYKFALLVSLVELAIEVPQLDGETELELSIRSIATKFIELYWRQSYEYVAGRPGTRAGVLVQNLGDQAAVVNAIRAFRDSADASGASLAVARRLPSSPALVARVAAVSLGSTTELPSELRRQDRRVLVYARAARLHPIAARCRLLPAAVSAVDPATRAVALGGPRQGKQA